MDSEGIKERRNAIVRKIRRFPQQERRTIIGEAIRDLDQDLQMPLGPDRFRVLLALAEEALGYALTSTRSRQNTELRMLVAKQMRSEGYRLEEIAAFMDRDHSTVSFYARTMDDVLAFPIAYGDLINKYADFKSKIDEYDKRNV